MNLFVNLYIFLIRDYTEGESKSVGETIYNDPVYDQ